MHEYECECGKELEDMRGARGHFQFTGGVVNGVDHGDKQTVPDGYKDYIIPVESDDEPDDDASDGDEGDTEPDSPDDESTPDREPSSGSSDGGVIRRVLNYDLKNLFKS